MIPSARMTRGCGSEIVELSIGESLGRGDNDAVAGVNAHGIEILHVANYCASCCPGPA